MEANTRTRRTHLRYSPTDLAWAYNDETKDHCTKGLCDETSASRRSAAGATAITSRANLATLAALLGFLGVAFGAFAAHGMDDPVAKTLIQTGASYQLVHALAALLALFMPVPTRKAAVAFLIGAVLFSGSVYGLALGAPRMIGVATPLGGLSFLAGWALLAWTARRQPD